jgi:hypothetical protein
VYDNPQDSNACECFATNRLHYRILDR